MLCALSACHPTAPHDGRVVVRYWDKWNGFEAEAMRAVVDDFNAGQNRVWVDYSAVSQLNHKLLLATSGGVPPDVAGMYAEDLPVYAENNALTPLYKLAAEAGVRREDYVDVFWQTSCHRGTLFALPATPNVSALVWNKKMFREAGLDPEQPPRSIAELEAFNEKILRRRPDGSIEKIGHVPNEPSWITPTWGTWFGARYWDGQAAVEADSPENRAAFRWMRSYPDRFGAQNLLALRDGFGSYASSQNPFLSGRVAMTLQGVWIYNFIKNYAAPGFEWGVAAFPSVDPARFKAVTVASGDVLVIPAGAKHVREAFEFLRYLESPAPMEKLCLGQRKFSPLRQVSEDFYRRHPDPYVRKFAELASSPGVRPVPRITTWNEYSADLADAAGRVLTGSADPDEALANVQKREQAHYDRARERWDRNVKTLTALWAAAESRQ